MTVTSGLSSSGKAHSSQYTEHMNTATDVDLLVVGAGPTGLTAALAGVQQGLRVRIIDQRQHRSQFSKALVTHARTVEVLEPLDVIDELMETGTMLRAIQAHGNYGADARIRMDRLRWGDTKYPYWLLMAQYEIESILETALHAHGVAVQWGTKCVTVQQDDARATAMVQDSNGSWSVTAQWILGADGSHSTVRQAIDISFERTESQATFLLADAHTTANLPPNEAHVNFSPDGVLLIIPVSKNGLWRIVANLPNEPVDSDETVTAQRLNLLVYERMGLEFGAHNIGWVSHFSPSHGVASALRSGRVFLAGDAAHVHSPVGGQGMNFGIQDAQNLVWKLATARNLRPELAEQLLDSYEAERLPVITTMVNQVRRLTALATRSGRLGRGLLGTVAPRVLKHTGVKNVLGNTLAGLDISYQHGDMVVANDNTSGTRAVAALQHLTASAWSWRLGQQTQLVRPDAVVALSGASIADIERQIAHHHPLLREILENVDPIIL